MFFGLDILLESADNVNEYTLRHTPSSVGTFTFICRVFSTTGERYESDVTFKVEGKIFLVIIIIFAIM